MEMNNFEFFNVQKFFKFGKNKEYKIIYNGIIPILNKDLYFYVDLGQLYFIRIAIFHRNR